MARRCITGAFLVVALVSPLSALAARAGGSTAVAAGIVHEINAVRETQGLEPLRLNGALERAARAHSVEMANVGYFAHRSADGRSFARRVRHWYALRARWSAGENLGWATPRIGGQRVVQLWLASPEHRANILDPSWRDVGCSVVHTRSAPGVFGDEPVTLITCDFGARS